MIRTGSHHVVTLVIGALVWLAPTGSEGATVEELQLRLNQLEGRIRRLEAKMGMVMEESDIAAAPSQATPSAPLAVQNHIVPELMLKKIHGAGAGSEGELRFYLQLKNNFGRDVSGFEGLFVLEDRSGNRLMEFAASIQKAMAGGNTVSWVGAIDIDSSHQGHREVMRASKEDLVLRLALKKVTFAGGTTQSYGK
jgi:hypothetical protein